MSLSLIQGYSSAEDEEERPEETRHHDDNFSDEDDNDDDEDDTRTKHGDSRFPNTYKPVIAPQSSLESALPSALDAFAEVAGPPKFLNYCVEDQSLGRNIIVHHRNRHRSRDKKDLPPGAVLEAKAQLVGIHERVRSDIEGTAPSAASDNEQKAPPATTTGSQPRSFSSMCLQCGIPKIYSSNLGMVCPVCPSDDTKKKGSTIKDKEKNKRMKGQSSHASWKSETEMQLRQHFD